MPKLLNLNSTVYELVNKYPEIVDIMKKLGFDAITNPAMLNTAGRIMTLKKGAAMKNIDIEHIKETLKANGFEIAE